MRILFDWTIPLIFRARNYQGAYSFNISAISDIFIFNVALNLALTTLELDIHSFVSHLITIL